MVLLISASLVAMITGMSHHAQPWKSFKIFGMLNIEIPILFFSLFFHFTRSYLKSSTAACDWAGCGHTPPGMSLPFYPVGCRSPAEGIQSILIYKY
jgi:hypothetical protein